MKWIKLILCLGGIWIFMKIAPLTLRELRAYRELENSSRAHGIDNSTLFYSEEPITFDAEIQIRDNLSTDK